MILQALHHLYERRANSSDPAERPAPLGFEEKEIPFVIEIGRDGRLIQIRDTRHIEGKKKIARAEQVPQSIKKTSGVAANLLWDTAEYVLGVNVEAKGKISKPERVREQHAAFRGRIQSLPEAALLDAGVVAVIAFLDAIDLDTLARMPVWEEIRMTNPLLSFQLQGDAELVCQRPAVRQAWVSSVSTDQPDGVCLVTGESTCIERLHSAIKGVWGAQTSGANIVSFNLDAFRSYGKQQGANAPVGKNAAAMYTTALNDLLARGSRQHVQVGDASTVFWSEEKTALEDDFALMFGEPGKDDPARDADRLKALYQSVLSGKYAATDATTRFYVLGLAPNAARISVRFWHVSTVGECASNMAQHFRDITTVHAPHESDTPSLFRLLVSCAAQGKADNIPPNLSGDVMRAILEGAPYPQSWLQAALRRCRAEQDVGYLRAAIIKACLNRSIRSRRTGEKELTVSLDETNPNVAYRLGRLFAALEKIQEEASPGLNVTIRERYYGAACSAPVTVFSTLLRLKNHHLAKLDSRGRATNFERLIGEIVSGIATDFPAHLALADQGRFAIGYYHQRQAFYTKADKTNGNQGENA